jgi:hypothetical protein
MTIYSNLTAPSPVSVTVIDSGPVHAAAMAALWADVDFDEEALKNLDASLLNPFAFVLEKDLKNA